MTAATGVKKTNINKITEKVKDAIIGAAFAKAVKEAAEAPKPNRMQRWHRINYAMQTEIEKEIKSRFPDLYATQARRLWTELILSAFGLDLCGFTRRK